MLELKKLIYFQLKPRIGHMCRASDRVRGEKLTFCRILEANCAGNNMNFTEIV